MKQCRKFEREKLLGDSGDTGSLPATGKIEKLNSFLLKRPDVHRTLIRCLRHVTGTIMLNYVYVCCPPFAEKCKSKGKRAQSKIKRQGRSAGKGGDRSAVWDTRGARCSDGRTWNSVLSYTPIGALSLLSFIYQVFLPVSFSMSMRVKPASKWLVPRATTPTADDDPESFDYSADRRANSFNEHGVCCNPRIR